MTHYTIWKTAIVFVAIIGLARLCFFFGIWLKSDPTFWYVIGFFDFAKAIVAIILTVQFWKVRNELILMGRTIAKLSRDEK